MEEDSNMLEERHASYIMPLDYTYFFLLALLKLMPRST